MRAIRLRTDDLKAPLGLGNVSPCFSWNVEGGVSQSAYRIQCFRNQEEVWDSGKVASASMRNIPYWGPALCSRDQITWQVTLWDEQGNSGEVSTSRFEMGLLRPEDWQARWITGAYRPNPKRRYPVDCFRKRFALGRVKQARLYATARGLYDVCINGERLRDFVFAPGSTDYNKRIQVQTWDVTGMLKAENTLELRLADGWYRGSCACYGVVNVFGTQTSLAAQLEVILEDGERVTIFTDSTWDWCSDGPVRFADLQDGEVYDASMEPSYTGKAAEAAPPGSARLVPSDNVPVQEHEHFPARWLPNRVMDFGQNLAGYLTFRVRGGKGQSIRVVCGELLDDQGNVSQKNIQDSRPRKGWTRWKLIRKLMTGKTSGETVNTPLQQVVFTCSGGEDHYHTSFSVFGFRYAQILGAEDVVVEQAEAIAVYSSMEETGDFACSDDRVNRLVQNTRWSMKSNYLDLPTDCPTRERLGWTGDAQIFYDTGAYLMDTAAFFRKWLRDMEDSQYADGTIPAVVPLNGVEMMYKATGSSVGWADAIYLIPWRQYLRTGDMETLRRCWPMMKRYANYCLKNLGQKDKKAARLNPDSAYTYEKGMHLGEWLEPEQFQEKVSAGRHANHAEEATAYFHLTMTTMADIARLLGEAELAERYADYADGSKRAYQRFAELDTDRQAKLVRPLALGLLEGDRKKAAQKRLKEAAEHFDYCVGTGFLSTPFLLKVLSEAGYADTAYRILFNPRKPGWLYEVEQGATSVWESWEGDVSHNHYSPGAVCGWLFDSCAGIRVAGENHLIIAPVPGDALTFAGARYQSPYGRVESKWERTDADSIRYTVTVPSNTTAEVILPGAECQTVGCGTYTFEISRRIKA